MTFEPFRAPVLVGGALAAFASGPAANAHAVHRDHVLGVSFDLTAAARDGESADRAAEAALLEIARLDGVLSAWRSDSELAALNSSARFAASPDLFAVIAYGEAMRARTGGAFSARLGRIRDAWRDGGASDGELLQLARSAETASVGLDPAMRTIARPGAVQFDIDGYAKGYVIDRALAAARRAAPGARGFLLNLGGDIGAWGSAPSGQAWRAGVTDSNIDNAIPVARVALLDAAIAASGGGARDYVRNGRSYAHFLSARTGQAGGANRSAAVVATSAMESDALATAVVNMPAARARALIEATPGAAARIVMQDGSALTSARWSALDAGSAATCQAATGGPPTPLPAGFQTAISFEVPRIAAANYERPYIAIWISDANRRLVKTLLVIGDEARWRESNYVFWRRIERLDMAGIQALARTSRAPGRYDVVWDGTDNAGARVGQGAYTVNIESSREHGGHSFQSVPLTLGAAPLEAAAEAQQEIGATRVRYGRAQ